MVLIGLTSLYFYVYVLVYRFFTKSYHFRTRHHIIRRISIRFLLSAFTFVLLLIWGMLTLTPVFDYAIGKSIVHFGLCTWVNLGSTFTISAFSYKADSKSMSGLTRSGTASGAAAQSGANNGSLSYRARLGRSDETKEDEDDSEYSEDATSEIDNAEEQPEDTQSNGHDKELTGAAAVVAN